MRSIRYILIIALAIAAWVLIDHLLVEPERTDRGSVGQRVKKLGHRVHWTVGVVAIMLLLLLAMRLIFHAMAGR